MSSPTDEPLRVCHVIHDLGAGGAEDLLVDLARVAGRAGFEMTVLSLMPLEDAVHAGRLRDLGVPVLSTGLRTRWDPTARLRAQRLVERVAPHILHTHLKHADIVGAGLSRRLGIPMVSTLHLIEDATTPLERLKRQAGLRARTRGAARTIAVSDALRRWYVTLPGVDPDRVVTIHNGVIPPPPLPAAERDALRRQLGIGADGVLAVTASIMRQGKGHGTLLRAAALIPHDRGVRLVLAGDGPLAEALREEATDLALGERVTFLGYRNDVDVLLQAADLVVHPSEIDALPTTLIRALAAETPAVATTVGGIPEIVTSDTGRLVGPGDAAGMAAAILELASDPGARTRMAVAGRNRFAVEYDAHVWARRLAACYAEVIHLTGRST